MNDTTPAIFSSTVPRLALFAGALIITTVLMHRLLGMSTPLALNLFLVAFALAAVALLLGLVSIGDVWRRGADGSAWAIIGMLVAGAVFAWPLAFVPSYMSLPAINDATTDPASPPRFQTLAVERQRSGAMNPADYPGQRFADLQKSAYPDLRPLYVSRPADETYELALETVKRLRFQIMAETPPRPRQPGLIEAVDRTMVIGFYDDVVVRVDSDGGRSRVDIRSASRVGTHDLGRNSARVRRILTEMQARVDASVATPGQRFQRIKSRLDKGKSTLKRGKGGDPRSTDRRNRSGASQPGAPRAPVQRTQQPGRVSGQ